jgi:hypothetical protein
MAVTVHFTDGTERFYPDASSAVLDGTMFRVRKWNAKRRKPEDVDVFPADAVTLAEVSEHGQIKEIIVGRGTARSN